MCMNAAMMNHRNNMEVLAQAFLEASPMEALKDLEETMRGIGAECALAFADNEDPLAVARTFAETTKRVTGRISAFVRESAARGKNT